MSTESKTSARKITALERERQSLDLRLTGLTYREIGEELKITEQGAYKAVIRALEKIKDKIEEKAEEVVIIEIQRLDKLFLIAFKKAERGDLSAIDRCLRIMERRAKLLGLDTPSKHELTGAEGNELKIIVEYADSKNHAS